MRPIFAGSWLAVFGVVSCTGANTVETETLRAEPVLLSADVVEQVDLGRLIYRGGFELSGSGIGGLSAADVSDDGTTMTVLSDTGSWFRFTLVNNPNGEIRGVRLAGRGSLLDAGGQVFASKGAGDSESLARLDDGRLVVGFEAQSKVLVYPPDLIGPPTPAATPPGLGSGNAGLEALTDLPNDQLLAIPEGGSRRHGVGPAWLGDGTEWRPVAYEIGDSFRPTGATTLPNGDVLVIERRFSFPATLTARFVRITPIQLGGDVIRGEEIARLDPPFPVDNFEAVTAYAQEGRIFIFILSDDNFSPFQRTLLLKFELTG